MCARLRRENKKTPDVSRLHEEEYESKDEEKKAPRGSVGKIRRCSIKRSGPAVESH